jgi:hypothetical protein
MKITAGAVPGSLPAMIPDKPGMLISKKHQINKMLLQKVRASTAFDNLCQ